MQICICLLRPLIFAYPGKALVKPSPFGNHFRTPFGVLLLIGHPTFLDVQVLYGAVPPWLLER